MSECGCVCVQSSNVTNWCVQVRRTSTTGKEDTVFAPLKLAQASLEQIKDFKENLPVIHILCNPGLRPRHWQKVSEDHHHIPPQCSLSHSLTRCQKSLGSILLLTLAPL